MTDDNMLIAQRIRAARLQRNLTQQDLANRFGKTSAAISDIERGKTQITAADIFIFAELLIKPIEYFYGEDYGDPEIEDLLAMIRKLPPEIRKRQLPMMTLMLKMEEINMNMQNTDDKEKQLEAVKEFYETFLPYYNMMDNMMGQLKEAKENIESLLH
jgi:transcriptional regulator with XRE-family HTH domain